MYKISKIPKVLKISNIINQTLDSFLAAFHSAIPFQTSDQIIKIIRMAFIMAMLAGVNRLINSS